DELAQRKLVEIVDLRAEVGQPLRHAPEYRGSRVRYTHSVPSSEKIRVSFICLGNICRSPTAEGIMRHLVERAGLSEAIEVESAGTGSWHLGEKADRRARATAEARGVTLNGRAQQFSETDFD